MACLVFGSCPHLEFTTSQYWGLPGSLQESKITPVEEAVAAHFCLSATLSQKVRRTSSKMRASSTRCLCAHTWKVFKIWCSSKCHNLVSCPILVIFSFLQERLDVRPYVYVAAISVFPSKVDKLSVYTLSAFILNAPDSLDQGCPNWAM